VSSPFGPRNINVPNASKNHKGTDFSHTFTIIRAVESGQVKVAGTPGGWSGGGIQVWVQHDGFFTKSLHAASLLVKVGQWVREGDPLCIMGQTGTASDDHLHFEVTPGNVHYSNTGQVDPVPFIANRLGSTAGGSTTEDDMPLNEEDLKNIRYSVQRALQYEARPGGFGANGQLGPTLWERIDLLEKGVSALIKVIPQNVWGHLVTAQDGKGGAAVSGGKPVQFPASGFLASTNAAAQSGGITEEQVRAIADAVVEATGTPTAKVDYTAIAKAVNDDAAKRLSS
jgi:hypothetical protein